MPAPGGRRRPATWRTARPARICSEAARLGAAGHLASAQSCRVQPPTSAAMAAAGQPARCRRLVDGEGRRPGARRGRRGSAAKRRSLELLATWPARRAAECSRLPRPPWRPLASRHDAGALVDGEGRRPGARRGRRGSAAKRRSLELLATWPARRAAECSRLPRPPWRPLASRHDAGAWWTAKAGDLAHSEAGAVFERAQKRGGKPAPKSRQGYLLSPQHQKGDINSRARFRK